MKKLFIGAVLLLVSGMLQARSWQVFNNTAYALSMKIEREHLAPRFEQLNAYERKTIDLEDSFMGGGASKPACSKRVLITDIKSNTPVFDKPLQDGCKNKSLTIVRSPAKVFEIIEQ